GAGRHRPAAGGQRDRGRDGARSAEQGAVGERAVPRDHPQVAGAEPAAQGARRRVGEAEAVVTARRFDLRVEQGSDYHLTIPVVDNAGTPYVVVGWSARGQVRRSLDDEEPVYELDDHLTGGATTVELNLPGEAISEWTWRQARYDIELVNPEGRPTRLLEGHVFVSPEVTR